MRISFRIPNVSAALGAFAALLGIATLVGWGLGIRPLVAPYPAIQMKPNAAVAFALLGAGLIGACRDTGAGRRLPVVLAACAGFLALLTAVQAVARLDFGIDDLLVRGSALLANGPNPARMSALTALALTLLASAVGTLGARGRSSLWFSTVFGALAGLLAMASVAGLVFGAEELLTLGAANATAPQTSAGLFVLSVGVFAARQDVPPASYFRRSDPGAALARRLLPPSLILPFLIGGLEVAGLKERIFDRELGIALFVITVALTATAFIVWAADALRKMDARRGHAEASHNALGEQYRGLEEQMRQAQKMEAVGRLAGGVAHDFNNILTAILGYAELLASELPVEGPAREDLEEIRVAGRRAADLTKQLLAFSRKQVLSPVVLDLAAVARDAQSILGRLIGEDVRLHMRLAPDTPHVRADRGQLEQALMNLAVNARDAMPSGGTLTLTTGAVRVDAGEAAARPGLRAGEYGILSVSDTGTGMTDEVLARLFEPFFTTKERGKGTGLGLATTYGIIKQSNGFISARSAPGRGSTFEILLPAVDAAVDEAGPPPAPPGRGAETILLVEDEPSVRRLARAALEAHGYTVLDAASGEAAILLARGHRGPVDLLVTDVIMPGMNGSDLARRVALERPTTRVLYMSGYTDEAIARHGVLEPGTDLLQKPFTPAEVARKVRAVLDRA